MNPDREKSHPMAIKLFDTGIQYGASSFEDFETYGYGELDDYGFWEYPLIKLEE